MRDLSVSLYSYVFPHYIILLYYKVTNEEPMKNENNITISIRNASSYN